jgi:hypothetical protein
VVSTVVRFAKQTSTSSVHAALNPFDQLCVPSTFGAVSGSGHVRESMQAGTCPRWTSTSPTTLHVCSSAYGPGVDRRDGPPHSSPTQPLAEQGVAPHPLGRGGGLLLRLGCQQNSAKKL